MIENYKTKIVDFYKERKRMPTYQEIMSLVGFKSKNAVYKLVNKLIAESFLKKDSTGHLIPNKLVGEIPILGLVEAGFPTTAEEDLSDTMNMDDYLIENRELTYLLKVKGDSMIDEGIKEGDQLLVERQNEAKDGQIVIAEVDGGFTVKFFRKQGNKIWLEPANKKYKPIYPENDLKIWAVVKAVVRKY